MAPLFGAKKNKKVAPSTSAGGATTTTTPGPSDSFKPKKTTKVCKQLRNIPPDGDIWCEGIHTDPASGAQRNYFRSVKTRDVYWDEPPSGAQFVVRRDELHLYPPKIGEFANTKLILPHWNDSKGKK